MEKQEQIVVVAMSGGVDSTVTAALLQKEGYHVIGVTLRLVECSEIKGNCCGIEGEARARYACSILSIPYYVINCIEAFTNRVLEKAWDVYAKGKTPNPCVLCNQHIKFGFLVDWAKKMNAIKVATGHYAIIRQDEDEQFHLFRGKDPHKDQSYFLSRLSQSDLAHALFPIGKLSKDEVKIMAKEMGLLHSEIKESQDACFSFPGKAYAELLREKVNGAVTQGNIIDQEDKILGNHQGTHLFTIGQHHGLGLSYPQRLYVTEIGANGNIKVSKEVDDLCAQSFIIQDTTFFTETIQQTFTCLVQMRYRQTPVSCSVQKLNNNRALIELDEPAYAITPGQVAVLYDNEEVLGSGFIDNLLKCK